MLLSFRFPFGSGVLVPSLTGKYSSSCQDRVRFLKIDLAITLKPSMSSKLAIKYKLAIKLENAKPRKLVWRAGLIAGYYQLFVVFFAAVLTPV